MSISLAFRRAPDIAHEAWSTNQRQVDALLKSTDDGMYPMLYSECLCRGSQKSLGEYHDFMNQLCARDPARAIRLHGKVVEQMQQDQGSQQNLRSVAALLEKKGRNGDTILAHITPEEAMHLKDHGGSGTRNPETGLLEFFVGGFNDRGIDDVGPSPSSSNGDWFSGGSSSGFGDSFSSSFDAFGDSFGDAFSSSSSYGLADEEEMRSKREEEERKALEEQRLADEKAAADQRAADEESRKATELADQQQAESNRQLKLAEQQRSTREQNFLEDNNPTSKEKITKVAENPVKAPQRKPLRNVAPPPPKPWWQSSGVPNAEDEAISANGRAVSALQKTTDNAEHSQWIAKDIAAGNKPAIAKLGNFLQQMEKVDPKRAKQYSDEVIKRLPKQSQDAIKALASEAEGKNQIGHPGYDGPDTRAEGYNGNHGYESEWMEQVREYKRQKAQATEQPVQTSQAPDYNTPRDPQDTSPTEVASDESVLRNQVVQINVQTTQGIIDEIEKFKNTRFGPGDHLEKEAAIARKIKETFPNGGVTAEVLLKRLDQDRYLSSSPISIEQLSDQKIQWELLRNEEFKQAVKTGDPKAYYQASREAHENLYDAIDNLGDEQAFLRNQKNFLWEDRADPNRQRTPKHQAIIDKQEDRLLGSMMDLDEKIAEAMDHPTLPYPQHDPAYVEREESWKKTGLDHALDAADLIGWFMPPAKIASKVLKGGMAAAKGVSALTSTASLYNNYRNSMLSGVENLVREQGLSGDPASVRNYLKANPEAFAKIRLGALLSSTGKLGNSMFAGKVIGRFNALHKTKFGTELVQPLQTAGEKVIEALSENIFAH